MKGVWNITSGRPYEEAAEIIEKWAYKNFFDTFVVSLVIDGKLETELLCVNESAELIWDNDWYEGQKDIIMIGFMPLSNIIVLGEPEKKRRYCYITTDLVLTDPSEREETP